MQITLTIVSGPNEGHRIWLREGQEFTVGRTDLSDWAVPHDPRISQVHFSVSVSQSEATVRDLGSTNGTLLNRMPLTQQQLTTGDVIQAGNTLMRVDVIQPVAPPMIEHTVPPHEAAVPAATPIANPIGARPSAAAVAAPAVPSAPPSPVAAGQSMLKPAGASVSPIPAAPSPEAVPPVSAGGESITGGPTRNPNPIRGVVLDFQDASGPRRIWLRPGQRATVGRLYDADYSIDGDSKLSGLHFALECGTDTCRVHDLGSSNGTHLNLCRVSEQARLYDGDLIDAGETRFLVSVDGGGPTPTESLRTAELDEQIRHGRQLSPHFATFAVERCQSSLFRFIDLAGEPDAADLYRRLARRSNASLLVDPSRCSWPGAHEAAFARADLLMDWLPEEAAAEISPYLLTPRTANKSAPFVQEAWGQDGQVCFFGHFKRAALLETLRQLARPAAGSESSGGSVIAYYWPSVLSVMLAHDRHGISKRLFDDVEAVFLESESLPRWQIFARRSFARMMTAVGFVETDPVETRSPETVPAEARTSAKSESDLVSEAHSP